MSSAIESAAKVLADAVKHEMELEAQRHVVKLAAVTRIMTSGDNPLTGKPHSFSSAEAIVETDQQYASHLEQLRNATYERILARGGYDSALAQARLTAEVA